MSREPESVDAFLAELGGGDARIDAAIVDLEKQLSDRENAEARARWIVERMAIVLEASLMQRYGDPDAADVFCDSRLAGGGHQFGTLRPREALSAIVERARPQI